AELVTLEVARSRVCCQPLLFFTRFYPQLSAWFGVSLIPRLHHMVHTPANNFFSPRPCETSVLALVAEKSSLDSHLLSLSSPVALVESSSPLFETANDH
ncbi:hypothetical protein CEXT_100831, partial [Caerostris extrusa]